MDAYHFGGIPPNRKLERALRAKNTVQAAVPELLKASPRARHGLAKADLVVDPEVPSYHGETPVSQLDASGPQVKLVISDVIDAASRMSARPYIVRPNAPKDAPKAPNVGILSFASQHRPGGGFLDGANSQQEFICCRTTVYATLLDSFYPLPDIGGVYSPDVMVFRDCTPEANELLKRDRFFIDVISASMIRFPGDPRTRHDEYYEPTCTCGISYCDRDREIVIRKMKAVMRIAQQKGIERLVLGAWGCGSYGNPVKEIAKLWRKVISGSVRQRRPNAERWQGIKEVVFAIPDRKMAVEFESVFRDILSHDSITPPDVEPGAGERDMHDDKEIAELFSQAQQKEIEIEFCRSGRQRQRLREELAELNFKLQRGLQARRTADGEEVEEEEEEEAKEDGAKDENDDDFVNVSSNMASSDFEDGSLLHALDSDGSGSGSLDSTAATESYMFRPAAGPPDLVDYGTSMDESELGLPHDSSEDPDRDVHTDDEEEEEENLPQLSQKFDPVTGWYSGSIDGLQTLMSYGGPGRIMVSRPSPPLEPRDASESLIPGLQLDRYLEKYEGQTPVREQRY